MPNKKNVLEEKKTRIVDRIDSLQDDLWKISHSLYQNPELAFKEKKSAALLTDILEENGFDVERGIGGLETAFSAIRSGNKKKPSIAFLAEYDALPKIGHGCGHNLIASAAIGAGLGVLDVLDTLQGQIRVIGTPAEEGGGGKVILADAGIFKGVDAAIMFHPSSKTMVLRGSLASMRLKLEFFGSPAHAAASPQEGMEEMQSM
jgi:amidohydrolase